MSETSARDPMFDLLDQTQRETRDLVGAICQSQVDRIHDLLANDFRSQVGHVLDERFSQLELSLRSRIAQARLEVARGLTQVLNECFLRMRRFESDRDWCEAMLDAASTLSRRSAFFSVRGSDLCLQGARGLPPDVALPPSEVPYEAAPGFNRVITTAATHSVSRSAAELSLPIAAMFGSDTQARALLVPVCTADRVPGVIYAEDAVDASAIELIASIAGTVLEKHLRLFETVRPSSGTVRPVAVRTGDAPPEDRPVMAAPAPPPARDPQQAEAQRFARVAVARFLLANPAAVSEGRRRRSLYRTMQKEVEAAREQYRMRFPTGPDQLHAEIVRTLALNDVSLLGREYPGSRA